MKDHPCKDIYEAHLALLRGIRLLREAVQIRFDQFEPGTATILALEGFKWLLDEEDALVDHQLLLDQIADPIRIATKRERLTQEDTFVRM